MHVSSHTCISPATQMYAACMCLWCICVLYIFVLRMPHINVCSMHVYAICMCLWCICVLYIFVLLIPRPSVCLRNYLSPFCVLRLLFRIQYLCIAYTSPSRFPKDSKIFMSYVWYFFSFITLMIQISFDLTFFVPAHSLPTHTIWLIWHVFYSWCIDFV